MPEQEVRPPSRKGAAALIAVAIAAPCEGLRQYAYYCPAGVLTVCYGDTTGVVKGRKYTLEECKAKLDADMLNAVNIVDRCVPGLPVNILAAFSDAVYNMGPTIVCNPSKSTAARLLRAKEYALACQQLPKWDKATVSGVSVSLPGLTKRRALDLATCLEPEPQLAV